MWSEAEKIVNERLPEGDWAYTCGEEGCCVKRGLRMTPVGPYCQDHYLYLPRCHCGEPVVTGKKVCRNHWIRDTVSPPPRRSSGPDHNAFDIGDDGGFHSAVTRGYYKVVPKRIQRMEIWRPE